MTTEKPKRGRPVGKGERTRSMTIRIKPELLERLDAAAEDRVVGRNLLLQYALERYLEELPPVRPVIEP